MDVATSTVHIESPREVELEHQAEGGGAWEVVCDSPCDRPSPVSGRYRINGSTTRTSATFELSRDPQTVVRVDPGSTLAQAGAILVTATGVAFAAPTLVITGAVVVVFVTGALLVCPIIASQRSDIGYGECVGDSTGFVAQGYTLRYVWVSGLISVPILASGAILVNMATGTRAEVDAPAGGSGPGPRVPDDASISAKVRRPEWVTGPERHGALTPPALPPMLPVVGSAF